MQDPHLYPGTAVLKNIENIKDEDELKKMESDYTILRLAELTSYKGDWDMSYDGLCQLHNHIFKDIFEWAGVQRKINIEKEEIVLGGLSVEYSDVFDIEKDAIGIIERADKTDWSQLSNEQQVQKFAELMADLWKVHPYREGNTRTIVTFCCMYIESKNIYIDSNLFKDNANYTRDALVAANAIFHDIGDKRKPEYLLRIVEDALDRGRTMKDDVKKAVSEAVDIYDDSTIKRVVRWNRIEEREHSSEEIRSYLLKSV